MSKVKELSDLFENSEDELFNKKMEKLVNNEYSRVEEDAIMAEIYREAEKSAFIKENNIYYSGMRFGMVLNMFLLVLFFGLIKILN